jgi:Rod binding domain-containing protein
MNVNPLQRQIVASDIAPEQLAGNSRLTEKQKIAEASRQFESVLLQQILGESQKTVIKSEFSDNSTAAGIYQDLITKTLSDNISKSGAFGLAKVFEQQLNRPADVNPKSAQGSSTKGSSVATVGTVTGRPENVVTEVVQPKPLIQNTVSFPVKQP